MTPRPPFPPAPSRTLNRRHLVVLRDEYRDHDEPSWSDPAGDAGHAPPTRGAELDGRTLQQGGGFVRHSWDGSGPEAA